MSQFITTWKYKVKSEKRNEFEKLYEKDDNWVKLFRNIRINIKTELIKDLNNNDIYITLDYWKSKEAYYKFKDATKQEFSKIAKKVKN